MVTVAASEYSVLVKCISISRYLDAQASLVSILSLTLSQLALRDFLSLTFQNFAQIIKMLRRIHTLETFLFAKNGIFKMLMKKLKLPQKMLKNIWTSWKSIIFYKNLENYFDQ